MQKAVKVRNRKTARLRQLVNNHRKNKMHPPKLMMVELVVVEKVPNNQPVTIIDLGSDKICRKGERCQHSGCLFIYLLVNMVCKEVLKIKSQLIYFRIVSICLWINVLFNWWFPLSYFLSPISQFTLRSNIQFLILKNAKFFNL